MRDGMEKIRVGSLFSGIGGFDLGLIQTGKYEIVWSCDNNEFANKIYRRHFPNHEHYSSDIRGVNPEEIPDFDLLCAGFPCQAFSVAGKRKGFKETRGTLFFEICRIAEAKRPKLLLLENVKGLLNHDGGRTFTVILQSLDELGYWVEWQVLNSKYFGVPQNRERVFIVGHLRGSSGREVFPIREDGSSDDKTQGKTQRVRPRIRDENSGVAGSLRVGGSEVIENLVAQTITERYYKDGSENLIALRNVRTEKAKQSRQESMKQGKDYTPFGEENRVLEPAKEQVTGALMGALNKDTLILHRSYKDKDGNPRVYENITPTITTPSGGGHIPDVLQNKRIRKLTPLECERLQGFPDNWTEGISDTQRYKCLGNAVTVNVIKFLGEQIINSCR